MTNRRRFQYIHHALWWWFQESDFAEVLGDVEWFIEDTVGDNLPDIRDLVDLEAEPPTRGVERYCTRAARLDFDLKVDS